MVKSPVKNMDKTISSLNVDIVVICLNGSAMEILIIEIHDI